MALTTIYPNGTSTVNIPATQSIAISNYGGGIASIYYLIENANRPDAFQLQQTLENAGVVLGAFADGKTVKIEAGGSTVVFDVGASPDTGIGDADTLNGMASDTGDTADTIAARDSSGDITANAFESTVATGTAPLTVASTTAVANLNADLLDGQQGSYYAVDSLAAHLAGAETFTGSKTFDSGTVMNGGLNFYMTTPFTRWHETDQSDAYCQIKRDGNYMYIQDQRIYFTSNAGGDVLEFKVRVSGTLESIYHTGNTSSFAHLAGAETFTGAKTFSGILVSSNRIDLNNNIYLWGYDTGATSRTLLGVSSSDVVDFGAAALPMNIKTNGTLQYNGTTLASGTFTTTDGKTVTVVDGFITSIV